ncbi:hypothetical protein ONZ45_g19572 [Pleurotus djamor]|nr:hypothetical protein ONZ45_g19572 [Pleurotus djamor]
MSSSNKSNKPILDVQPYTDSKFQPVAGKSVDVPADPPHSHTEARELHERILKAKERWGISYSDAANLLFLAASDTASKNMKLQTSLNNQISKINNALNLFRTEDRQPTRPPTPPTPQDQTASESSP